MDKGEIEILLVEDNPTDAELAIRALKSRMLANKIVHVKDGAAALETIFGEDDDLQPINGTLKVILLDLKLPKVNGIEVLERLKGDPRTRSIPVVVLTSSREDSDLTRCYELGVNSYIVKPVDFESFVNVVADLGLYWLVRNQAA